MKELLNAISYETNSKQYALTDTLKVCAQKVTFLHLSSVAKVKSWE